VHEVAEQLEHIQSPKLIERLDKFLNFPTTDPHGDLIPDAKGEMKTEPRRPLSEVDRGKWCRMVAIGNDTPSFLNYVARVGLAINTRIKVLSKEEYDGTMSISVNGESATISGRFADNILVV
jgi:DtxR family Mn-dependent transcriptional regulator